MPQKTKAGGKKSKIIKKWRSSEESKRNCRKAKDNGKDLFMRRDGHTHTHTHTTQQQQQLIGI